MNTTQPTIIQPPNRDRLLLLIDRLPPAPPVLAKLTDLVQDGGGSPESVARLIGVDPLLADHLRRFVPAVEGEAIEDVVHILGVATVYRIGVAHAVQTRLAACRDAQLSELDPARFWTRSLATACAARSIARMTSETRESEQLFHSGLLRHLGMLVLDAAVPRSFARVLRRAPDARRALSEVARHVIGIDHRCAGRRFAERWALPPELIDAVGGHGDGFSTAASPMAGSRRRILELAHLISRKREPYPDIAGPHGDACNELAVSTGLSVEALDRVVDELPARIEAARAWIAPAVEWAGVDSSRAIMRSFDEHAGARLKLIEDRRQWRRDRRFSAAADWMCRSLRTGASLSETCAVVARAVRRIVDAGVVVFARGDDRHWMHIGRSSGEPDGDVVAAPQDDFQSFMRRSLQREGDERWLQPGGDWSQWAPALSALSADRRLLNMPIPVEDRRLAGALVALSPNCRDESIVHCPDWRRLCTIAGRVLDASIWRARAEDGNASVRGGDLSAATDTRSTTPKETADAVASLASGAAHDLNTPLAVISGRAQLLAARPENAAIHPDLEVIRQQVDAATGVVNELMDLAEATLSRPQRIDLFELLPTCKSGWIADELLDAGDIEIDIAPDTPDIRFDREQLSQLLRDLALNALAATNEITRRLSIKAAPDMTEDLVVLSVIDNGCGMTPTVRHRAFDPMFSGRRAGRSRGLGLTRARRRVEAAGGSIELASEAGIGTCVTLRLPAAGREAPATDGRESLGA